MSTQTEDAAVMTGYLLGSLSDAETERLDELSITDADFAHALSAVERDLIDAYVQGELAGAELERFESAYVVSPLRRARVDFAKALQAFGGREAQPSRVPSTFAARFTLRPALQAALAAAALVLLAAAGWLAIENLRLRQQHSEARTAAALAGPREQQLEKELGRVQVEREGLAQQLARLENPGIVAVTLSPQMRSLGGMPDVRLRPGVEYVAIQLELEPSEHTLFQAELLDLSGRPPLWTSLALAPEVAAGRRTLHVTLRAGLLTAQPYLLRLSGFSERLRAEPIGEYRFSVTKP